MKISIIVGSQRQVSQSAKVGAYLAKQLADKFGATTFTVDLGKTPLPLWAEDKRTDGEVWRTKWAPVSKEILSSDAIVAIAPEYGGMVPPALKNFFLLCESGEIFHKPGLIVSVSASGNGAYPVAELRCTSYKNSRLLWIPENLIIRYAEKILNDDSAELSKEDAYIRRRADYALGVLIAYAKAIAPVREFAESGRKDYSNGM